MNWRRDLYSVIGTDVGARTLAMVQLTRDRSAWAVEALAREDLPPFDGDDARARAEHITRTLRRLHRQGGFHGRRIAAALPANAVDVRSLRVSSAQADLADCVRWEVECYLNHPIEQAMLDFWVVGEAVDRGEAKTEVMVATARRDVVEAYLEMFIAAGLHPQVLDVLPCAIGRVLGTGPSDAADEPVAGLDIGSEQSTLVMRRGSTVVFCRRIAAGGHQISETLCRELDLDLASAERLKREHGIEMGDRGWRHGSTAADAIPPDQIPKVIYNVARPALDRLAGEVARSLVYYADRVKGPPISDLRLTGGGAHLRGLDAFLHEQLGVPCRVIDPTQAAGVACRGGLAEQVSCEDAAALGLALVETEANAGARQSSAVEPVPIGAQSGARS